MTADDPSSAHEKRIAHGTAAHCTDRASTGFTMTLSAQDVRRIAELARLELSPSEAEHTLAQLNGVFDIIEQLKAVDTSGVIPMTHARDVALRLRDDAVTEPDRRDAYQSVAPAVDRGLYLVPKVIE